MFHDSVDLFLNSKEFPIGFNIYDFNGVANEDYKTIELLLKTLPKSVLLIQIEDSTYISEILSKII